MCRDIYLWALNRFSMKWLMKTKRFKLGADKPFLCRILWRINLSYLEIALGDKVLEVGTGSGYQAAVLAEMGAKVFSIERQKSLFDKTAPFLRELGYTSIKTFFGDGFVGVPGFAPFDKVIITAAADEIPRKLLEQMMIGGQMVIPLNDETKTVMRRITRIEENEYEEEQFIDCAFVPMLKGKAY